MEAPAAFMADTHREYGYFSWANLIKGVLTRRVFRAVMTLRLCQAVAGSRGLSRSGLLICRVAHRITTRRAAIDMPWQTDIGPGIALVHGWGLVINSGARIGKNVTLFHGVTLGRRDHISKDGQRITEYPTLEDEVWVGPHAIIVGGVTIGRGSRIAGGAFVIESVPPYSVVQGNPASIVKSNCVPDVMRPAPV